ncbi:DUF2207 domain-containing protein [Microbacterium sp. P01]|uniref:DUF2207 domain-containing protein n=1 Tax=Microbacterium sp. P01 TaxID=3366261 RepID=UPI0036704B56
MRRMLRRLGLAMATGAASALLLAGPALATVAPEAPRQTGSTAAAVTAVGPGGAPASVEDFTFQSMDADYTLGRADDGSSTLTVVETFVADFPDSDQNRGMRRAIPDTYNGQPLFPRLVSITDESGDARPAETDSEDGTFQMTSRADDYVHGAQTYVFTYTLENVTWTFDDTEAEEFYWDVNGVQWPQPFGRVTARLHVPADLEGSLTGNTACYVGSQGSNDPCEIGTSSDADGGTVVEASATGLAAYQTVTMAVAFTRGTFTPFDSSYLASPWGWVQALTGLGAAAVVVLAAITRSRKLRDAAGRPTIIAEYTPPSGVDALESAVLLGKPAKAIPAEVLEQAVVGSIRIVEGDKRWYGGAPLRAELIDPSRADGDGRMLLDGLFPDLAPGAVFEFGRSDTRFSKAAQAILAEAGTEIYARGLRRKVGAGPRMLPIVLSILLAIAAGVFAMVAIFGGVSPLFPVLVLVFAVIAAFVAIGLVSNTPLTPLGAETRDHLQGLKVFMEWAEADRIRMLQSPAGAERRPVDTGDPRQMLDLYETLLPYAVVFGLEKQWAERLAVLYGPDYTPTWYYGTGGFSAAAFSSGIGTLSATASSSSSTSGGSSGGGGAGGGGGGGGGGGV